MDFTVPDPENVSIETIPWKEVYNVNDSVQVNCKASLNLSFIDSNLTVSMTFVNNYTSNLYYYGTRSSWNSTLLFNSNAITINSLSLLNAGNYSCSVQVSDEKNKLMSFKITAFSDLYMKGK